MRLIGPVQPEALPERRSTVAAGPSVSRRPLEAMTPAQLSRLVALGSALRAIREAAGVKIDDLVDVAGSEGSLRSIERGVVRTRASRIRPWLARLGHSPGEIEDFLERFGDAIAPERPDGKPYAPTPRLATEPRRRRRGLTPPPLAAHDRAAVGARLWRERVDAGLNRRELATAIGCSPVSVWLIEHGLRRPTAELVERWLDATGDRVARLYLEFRYPGLIASRPSRSVGRRPRINPSTRQRSDSTGKGTP